MRGYSAFLGTMVLVTASSVAVSVPALAHCGMDHSAQAHMSLIPKAKKVAKLPASPVVAPAVATAAPTEDTNGHLTAAKKKNIEAQIAVFAAESKLRDAHDKVLADYEKGTVDLAVTTAGGAVAVAALPIAGIGAAAPAAGGIGATATGIGVAATGVGVTVAGEVANVKLGNTDLLSAGANSFASVTESAAGGLAQTVVQKVVAKSLPVVSFVKTGLDFRADKIKADSDIAAEALAQAEYDSANRYLDSLPKE